MYYVYILRNIDTKEFYYGYSKDLERRLKEHNINEEWKLIYYEAYISKLDAREREYKLKQYGQSRNHLKYRIRRSLEL